MTEITAKQIEKIINNIFTPEELKTHNFYTAGKIPALTIIRLSAQFSTLNLAKENILLLYDQSAGLSNKGFILTDCNLHFGKGFMPLSKIMQLFDKQTNKLVLPLPNLPPEMLTKVEQMLNEIKSYDTTANMNIAKYGKLANKNEIKELTEDNASPVNISNNNEGINDDQGLTTEEAIKLDLVDLEFLKQMKDMGDQALKLCKDLDNDNDFVQAVERMGNPNTEIIINKTSAKELLTQDLIKIFYLSAVADRNTSRREQFAMAYIFERLIGNGDMATSIKLSRINEMITNPKFQENIEQLKQFQIFKVKGEFNNEFLLPVILSKLKHESIDRVAKFLNDFTHQVLKADGTVSPEEEKILKQVMNMVYNPKKAIPNVRQTEPDQADTMESVLNELNELVGLVQIKKDVQNLINFLKIQRLREDEKLAKSDRALHTVFIGPPGTGKTTIARMLAKIYKQLNFLERGHLVETDRAGLVAGYIGQTALKVDEVVKASLDGVLFIDEAYALTRGDDSGKDFGNEAVETLLKRMEDNRDRLVVIVAGYNAEMEKFINSNPGLKSRFNRYFHFDHYIPSELLQIFKLFTKKADYNITEEAEEKLLFIFEKLYEHRSDNFGNARVVRNIFEECIDNQANRIVSVAPITKEILMTITEEDIPEQNYIIKKVLVFNPKEKTPKDPEAAVNMTQLNELAKIMTQQTPTTAPIENAQKDPNTNNETTTK